MFFLVIYIIREHGSDVVKISKKMIKFLISLVVKPTSSEFDSTAQKLVDEIVVNEATDKTLLGRLKRLSKNLKAGKNATLEIMGDWGINVSPVKSSDEDLEEFISDILKRDKKNY